MRINYLLGVCLFLLTNFSVFSQNHKFFEESGIEIGNAWFNTTSSEIGPAIMGNQLIFNSGNVVKMDSGEKGKSAEQVFYDLYAVAFNNIGTLSVELKRMSSVVTPFHEGPLSYCEHTGQLFLTQSILDETEVENVVFKKENVRLGIAIYKQTATGWELADYFPFNNRRYSVAHPAINATGDTLVFASDMPKGVGGIDLYYSVKVNGYWSEPVNLGDNINTPGNDLFPFLDTDGTLIFSSDGRAGKGGLDLYATKLSSSQPQEVIHLGDGFNSGADDFGLIAEPRHRFGFFASNREGGHGDDDIYYFKAADYRFNLVSASSLSNQILTGVDLKVFDSNDDLVIEGFTDEKGRLPVKLGLNQKYQVLASMEDFRSVLREVNLTGEGEFVEKDELVLMEPIYRLDGEIVDMVERTPVPGAFVLLMKDGQLQDTLRADEEGRFSARVQPGQQYYVNISNEHYINAELDISTVGMDEGAMFYFFELYPLKSGTRMVLNNMEFAAGNFELRPDAIRELNRLVIVLIENPDLQIRIEVHTDSRGNDQVNLELSRSRAEAIYNYLISGGIDPDRMEYVGLGETQLVNECDDGVFCTEGQHAQNRRVIVEIL
ncbi:OmpA family protein [Gaoshiqia sediminis]|uniref:OmpA family protein n=1 Tax=Gaoshiqia sediminis TaxID=2986998 RepID=A0AA42C7H2_9BACT|nr:OmpA family protein [Gaoshiqia sediminis]MCW0484983.1 OmpA family protein [Gaoshiqia sediminis]